MSKHTTGPWRVDGGRCGHRSQNLMIVHGGEDTFSPIIADVKSDDGRLPREANAALIAISPDLLAVAKGVLSALSYPRGSEAQVRCLEEVGQDARYLLGELGEAS